VRGESEGRLREGFLSLVLQAVWRDLAALGSLIAVEMVSRSAAAMADMLVILSDWFLGCEFSVYTCAGLLLEVLSRVPWLPSWRACCVLLSIGAAGLGHLSGMPLLP